MGGTSDDGEGGGGGDGHYYSFRDDDEYDVDDYHDVHDDFVGGDSAAHHKGDSYRDRNYDHKEGRGADDDGNEDAEDEEEEDYADQFVDHQFRQLLRVTHGAHPLPSLGHRGRLGALGDDTLAGTAGLADPHAPLEQGMSSAGGSLAAAALSKAGQTGVSSAAGLAAGPAGNGGDGYGAYWTARRERLAAVAGNGTRGAGGSPPSRPVGDGLDASSTSHAGGVDGNINAGSVVGAVVSGNSSVGGAGNAGTKTGEAGGEGGAGEGIRDLRGAREVDVENRRLLSRLCAVEEQLSENEARLHEVQEEGCIQQMLLCSALAKQAELKVDLQAAAGELAAAQEALAKSKKSCAEAEAGRRSARVALVECAAQNTRLVAAFADKKREVRTLTATLAKEREAHAAALAEAAARLQATTTQVEQLSAALFAAKSKILAMEEKGRSADRAPMEKGRGGGGEVDKGRGGGGGRGDLEKGRSGGGEGASDKGRQMDGRGNGEGEKELGKGGEGQAAMDKGRRGGIDPVGENSQDPQSGVSAAVYASSDGAHRKGMWPGQDGPAWKKIAEGNEGAEEKRNARETYGGGAENLAGANLAANVRSESVHVRPERLHVRSDSFNNADASNTLSGFVPHAGGYAREAWTPSQQQPSREQPPVVHGSRVYLGEDGFRVAYDSGDEEASLASCDSLATDENKGSGTKGGGEDGEDGVVPQQEATSGRTTQEGGYGGRCDGGLFYEEEEGSIEGDDDGDRDSQAGVGSPTSADSLGEDEEERRGRGGSGGSGRSGRAGARMGGGQGKGGGMGSHAQSSYTQAGAERRNGQHNGPGDGHYNGYGFSSGGDSSCSGKPRGDDGTVAPGKAGDAVTANNKSGEATRTGGATGPVESGAGSAAATAAAAAAAAAMAGVGEGRAKADNTSAYAAPAAASSKPVPSGTSTASAAAAATATRPATTAAAKSAIGAAPAGSAAAATRGGLREGGVVREAGAGAVPLSSSSSSSSVSAPAATATTAPVAANSTGNVTAAAAHGGANGVAASAGDGGDAHDAEAARALEEERRTRALEEENQRLAQEVRKLASMHSAAMEENRQASRHAEASKHKTAGNNAFNQGKFEQAVADYSAALAAGWADPQFNAIVACNRAAAHAAMGRTMDALADCNAALGWDKGYARARQRRAELFFKIGDFSRSLKDLEWLAANAGAPISVELETKLGDARRHVRRNTPMDLYAVLCVQHNGTPADIKAAYRKLALRHHPDKAKEGEREGAELLFKHIGHAYTVLSDPEQRQKYNFKMLGQNRMLGRAMSFPSYVHQTFY
eukprot:jgi/Mesvir1/8918/Mv14203-RA.1